MAAQRRLRAAASPRPLRVRTGRSYPFDFVVDLGQRHTDFVRRPLTPLKRVWAAGDALTPVVDFDYDLIHSVNAVPLITRKPYVITFEDYLPRVPEDRYNRRLETWLRRRLVSEQCRGIVAMSRYAIRQFRWQNRDAPELPQLEQKLRLIYPGVEVRDRSPKRVGNTMNMLFVGSAFMAKGGPAVVRAHRALRKAHVPLTTTVVSDLYWAPEHYVGPPSREYVERQHRLLAAEGIVHHGVLPNRDVRRLMREAHILAVPTLTDTFGYVSLEAIACGTPVLASSTCVQPEIIDDGESGFLLPFENDDNIGKWTWLYRNHDPSYLDAYEAAIDSLANALAAYIMKIWEEPEIYEKLSHGAVAKARRRFDRLVIREQLEELYSQAAR